MKVNETRAAEFAKKRAAELQAEKDAVAAAKAAEAPPAETAPAEEAPEAKAPEAEVTEEAAPEAAEDNTEKKA